MLKTSANKIISELKKTNKINNIEFNQPIDTNLAVYLDGDFNKRSKKKLKLIVESFSDKKVQIEFDYPDSVCVDGKLSKNKNMIVIGLRRLILTS